MEQVPGRPDERSSTGWRIALGCGVGCLFLLIVAGVACGLVCRHVTRRQPVDRAATVLTGSERGHAWLYVTEEDPGMAAIRGHLERALERMAQETGQRGTRVQLSQPAMFLPARLQVRAYPPLPGEDDVLYVGEIELSGGYNIFATLLRFVARERREAIGPASVYHFPRGDGGDAWLGVTGNRFVVARVRDLVLPLVDGTHPPAPVRAPGELQGLVEAVRLPTEDAGAWANGGADLGLGWMRFGALSADFATEDRIDFQAAFGLPEDLEAPREESARRVEDWIREKVPGELVVTLGEPEWLDARTVRYRGTVTGLAAALEEWVRRPEKEEPTTTPPAP